MTKSLFAAVEEQINLQQILNKREYSPNTCTEKVSSKKIDEIIRQRLAANRERAQRETLYELVLIYIARLGDARFRRKNGEINEAAFYRYAYIDKSTWSDLKYDKIVPQKKTLLKLIIALRLDEAEAVDLMNRGHKWFDEQDMQDQIILALIALRHYDIDDVMAVLEEYRTNGPQPFDSIYDTPEMIAERKKNDKKE